MLEATAIPAAALTEPVRNSVSTGLRSGGLQRDTQEKRKSTCVNTPTIKKGQFGYGEFENMDQREGPCEERLICALLIIATMTTARRRLEETELCIDNPEAIRFRGVVRGENTNSGLDVVTHLDIH